MCTSEAFAFITRWIKPESPARPAPVERSAPASAEKLDTYRQILQPTASGPRATKWLRKGGLLIAAAYLIRQGWHIASRRTRGGTDEGQPSSGA